MDPPPSAVAGSGCGTPWREGPPMSGMGRREFVALFGCAAAWPLAARAQQLNVPLVGFLHLGSPQARTQRLAAFRQGLADNGYIDGHNVAIEYRWAEERYERPPGLAADLLGRQGVVIATPLSTRAAPAAKAATSTIPIAFGVTDDPVKLGLVASMNRPSGNATGVSNFGGGLGPKRLGLLHEALPQSSLIAVLRHPNSPIAESAVAE